jgi:hypothetical protein
MRAAIKIKRKYAYLSNDRFACLPAPLLLTTLLQLLLQQIKRHANRSTTLGQNRVISALTLSGAKHRQLFSGFRKPLHHYSASARTLSSLVEWSYRRTARYGISNQLPATFTLGNGPRILNPRML